MKKRKRVRGMVDVPFMAEVVPIAFHVKQTEHIDEGFLYKIKQRKYFSVSI